MNRRTVLSKTGALALTALGLNSTATATTDKQSLESAGIESAYDSLFERGKLEQAEALLRTHDVAYRWSTVPLGPKQSSDDDVSTDLYSRSDATVNLCAVHDRGDYYSADLYWRLYADDANDVPGPNDGVGISFAADRWAYEPGTAETSAYVSKVDPNPDGVLAEFDDHDAYNHQSQPNEGYLRTQLEKQERGEHNVYGHYGHTYYGNGIGWGGVTFTVNVGFLGIAFDGSGDKWKKPSNTVEL